MAQQYRRNPEAALKIAERNGYEILMIDFPLTNRLVRHVRYDHQGNHVAQHRWIGEAIGSIVDEGKRRIMLDSLMWPRPLYFTVRRTLRERPWQK